MRHGKILSIFSAALLGLSAAAFPPASPDESVGIVAKAANEQTYTYGDFEYSYVPGSSEATLTRYLGNSNEVSISAWVPAPDGIWKTVTVIGDFVFNAKTYITKVTIPNTVITIGHCAFSRTSVTEIVIPASVQMIRIHAFSSCTALRTLTIQGAALIKMNAFKDCTALTNAKLVENCTAEKFAFSNCTSLEKVKSVSPWYRSGGKPVLRGDSDIRKLLKNVFIKSENVKFMNDYTEALCDYIVATETRSWMKPLIKARQLHDWLIRHVDYEDEANGEAKSDPENHNVEGLCLSYGLNIRGQGVGETVCEGYAKTYKKLLEKVGINSYLVRADGYNTITGNGEGHAWNLVKIGNTYYQVDVTSDEGRAHGTANENNIYGTCYEFFMLSNSDRHNAHIHYSHFNFTSVFPHPDNNSPAAAAALQNCSTVSLADGNHAALQENHDGLLDGDVTLDGVFDNNDLIGMYLLSIGDWNWDGQVNEADAQLIQLYQYFCGNLPLSFPTWLYYCIQIFGD